MRQGIKEKDIRDFEKYARKLADVVKRIREYRPEASAYLGMDTLYLMSDDFHNPDCTMNQNYVVTDVNN